jgi:hypothetical protein
MGWKNPDPGSEIEKSRSSIWDEHPGSATMLKVLKFFVY